MRVAHVAQGLADLQHCRVRRQHVERLAWRGRGEGGRYGLLAGRDYGAYRELGVLEAHGHVFGPDAADGERGGIRFALLLASASISKSTSQSQETSRPS